MTVYERIKNRRKELGLSADDVANALCVSRATVYRYESADIEKVPMTSLEPLSKVLRCTPAYLMGWDESGAENVADYYLDDKSKDAAQFLFENPEYQVLFDATRKVKPEDIEFVRQMIDRLTNN